jgi:hypothetical protein
VAARRSLDHRRSRFWDFNRGHADLPARRHGHQGTSSRSRRAGRRQAGPLPPRRRAARLPREADLCGCPHKSAYHESALPSEPSLQRTTARREPRDPSGRSSKRTISITVGVVSRALTSSSLPEGSRRIGAGIGVLLSSGVTTRGNCGLKVIPQPFRAMVRRRGTRASPRSRRARCAARRRLRR